MDWEPFHMKILLKEPMKEKQEKTDAYKKSRNTRYPANSPSRM